MSTTTNYLINLYRSLIIKRDELKKQAEENQKYNYQRLHLMPRMSKYNDQSK